MAKTYTLTPTYYGGKYGGSTDDFSKLVAASEARIGGNGGDSLYGTSFFLTTGTDSNGIKRTPAQFEALYKKGAISSIELTTEHNSTKCVKDADVRYGPKSTTSTSNWTISESYIITAGLKNSASSNTFDITNAGIPSTFAYTLGGIVKHYYSVVTSASMTIVTKETDFELSYNANNGSGAPASVTNVDYQSTTFKISTAAPTREGYLFRGWALSETATEPSYVGGDSLTVTSNTTLYAVWMSANLQVTLDCQNGTLEDGASSQIFYTSYDSNYGISVAQIPTRLNYKFKGWSLYPWQFFPIKSTTKVWISQPHVLYAWWEPDPPFKRTTIYCM